MASGNASEVDLKVIKLTQQILGKVIKKPPLTEKLLRRPPFKFIHDIVTSIIKTNGFLKGLFTVSELNAENLKDKEKKIAFLQKLIDVISIIAEKSVTVKASKIVAGLEAEKTNQFLQIYGRLAFANKNAKDAIDKVLKKSNISSNNNSTKNNDTKVQSSKVTEGKHAISTNKPASVVPTTSTSTAEEKVEDEKLVKVENKLTDKNQMLEKSRLKSAKQTNNNSDKQTNDKNNNNTDDDEKNSIVNEVKNEAGKQTSVELSETIIIKQTSVPEVTVRPPTAFNAEQTQSDDLPQTKPQILSSSIADAIAAVQQENPPDISKSNISRPKTARAAPPRVIKKRDFEKEAEAEKEEELKRILAAKPVENLIVESEIKRKEHPGNTESDVNKTDNGNDDDDLFVVETSHNRNDYANDKNFNDNGSSYNDISINNNSSRSGDNAYVDASNDKYNGKHNSGGKKVNQLDNSNNDNDEDTELNGGDKIRLTERLKNFSSTSIIESEKGSLVKQLVNTERKLEGKINDDDNEDEKRLNENDDKFVYRDLEKLKENIQIITRIINPLGRLIDYMQENIDTMESEIRNWNDEHKMNLIQLDLERNKVDSVINNYRNELDILDERILKEQDAINLLKANIIKNNEKLEKLVQVIVEK